MRALLVSSIQGNVALFSHLLDGGAALGIDRERRRRCVWCVEGEEGAVCGVEEGELVGERSIGGGNGFGSGIDMEGESSVGVLHD